MPTTEISPGVFFNYVPPRAEMAILQIVELYRDGYISLQEAQELAETHSPYLARSMSWLGVK